MAAKYISLPTSELNFVSYRVFPIQGFIDLDLFIFITSTDCLTLCSIQEFKKDPTSKITMFGEPKNVIETVDYRSLMQESFTKPKKTLMKQES